MNDSIEKHSFKISIATAVIVIIFLISVTATFYGGKAEIQASNNELDDRITHVGEKVVDMRADIELLKEQANGRDIQLAQINTKLANIEALLLEIRLDIKNENRGE